MLENCRERLGFLAKMVESGPREREKGVFIWGP